MAEFVGGVAIQVGKCIVEPIKRQFNYLCCFNTNIQNLRDEAKKLEDIMIGIEGEVDVAKRNNEMIVPRVETWLDDVNKIQANKCAIEPEIQNTKNGCLMRSRFSLSRKATKMVEAIKELQEDGRFGQISHPPPPAAMASIPSGQAYELESRKHVEEDIMAILREKKVRMIGICGMGGVGKTTMAKKIRSRAKGEGLFDEIVMSVVSQPVDMFKIQQEMAEFLGLRLGFESIAARAHQLHTRLTSTKSILIILDDLWEELDLEELGILDQGELKECTILLTSRNRDVFGAMSVDKIFQIKILSEKEAWSLFKEKIGNCAHEQSLFPAAQQIVQECKGLPIALVTVGMALKDKTTISIWEDAVQELRSSNPDDIPKFLARVYNPLKLSYDLLESKHAKSIFLLCCLFPEDHDIPLCDLSLYGWGLGMFEGTRSQQFARHKVRALVEMLKSRSLLLDDCDGGFTKMHDVVRDVGIFIATKEGLIDPNLSQKSWLREEIHHVIDCTWISFFGAQEITFLEGSIFPNLHFLLFEASWTTRGLPLSDSLFESARKLNVLSIKYNTLRSLPHTIQLLKNLRALILYSCSHLEDMSIVGELARLEILYCYDCGSITELPVEIGRLNQLKLLNISACFRIRTIAAGVISRLIRLEELTLIGGFKGWALGGSEGENAALCELNALSSLTTLKIQIEDVSLVSEQVHLSQNLTEFNITIGEEITWPTDCGREIQLELKRDVVIGDWIHQLARNTESLIITGEGSSKLFPLLTEVQSLKHLDIRMAKMTTLIDGSTGPTSDVFPLLESLKLYQIDNLEEIYKGPISSNSFKNLKEIDLVSLPKLQHLWKVVPHFCSISSIYISKCCSLRSVFPWAIGSDYLLRVKSLVIKACSMLEQVVMLDEENGQSGRINFPKLEKLFLDDLPRLTTLCKGIDSTEFPALTEMKIVKCPNLKSLVSSTENDHEKCWNDGSLHLFCSPGQATFGRLDELQIDGYDSISSLWCGQISIDFFTGLSVLIVFQCGNIKSLFSISIAKNLVNLRGLDIRSCNEMVKVIKDEEVGRSPFMNLNCGITFPKLEGLYLHDLPKLTSFCKGIQSIEFPLLIEMDIKRCPNLKSVLSSIENDQKCSGDIKHDVDSFHLFCISKTAFGKPKEVRIDGYESINLWCDQISVDMFTRLDILKVCNCGNIKSLFPVSTARNLVNLRNLHIESCGEMVKVLEDEEVERTPFIKLKQLNLENLPKLKVFCGWRCVFHLPSLTRVYIEKCPEMERFSFGSLITPKLEEISIDWEDISNYTTDLNDALLEGEFLHLDILFGSD